MNGILIINKPKGITSRDVVNKISKILNIKKVGHNGTLDPLAEGVLVICLGKYTKLNELLTSKEKEYIAEVTLGIKTDTLDITGNAIEKRKETLDIEKLKKIINSFPKTYMQEVPKYSAVKVNGKKLYEYAREGIKIKLPKKEVSIKSLELLDYSENKFTLRAIVSKGTYIRSLIRDILNEMNIIGTMSSLTRTKQGNFYIENSYQIEDIENGNFQILKIKDVLDLPIIIAGDELKSKIINGVKLKENYPDKVLFIDKEGKELAIYKKDNGVMIVQVMLI